jgi:hypothetical protein
VTLPPGRFMLAIAHWKRPKCAFGPARRCPLWVTRPSYFVPVLNNVRYTSDSDHSRYESELTLWANSGQSALQQRVSLLMSLFDHFVSGREQRLRDIQSEHLGGLAVDGQLELGRLFHWQVAGLGTLQYFVDVNSRPITHLDLVR